MHSSVTAYLSIRIYGARLIKTASLKPRNPPWKTAAALNVTEFIIYLREKTRLFLYCL